MPEETDEDPDEDQGGLTDDDQSDENPEKNPNNSGDTETPQGIEPEKAGNPSAPETGDDFTAGYAAAFLLLGAAILLRAAGREKSRM